MEEQEGRAEALSADLAKYFEVGVWKVGGRGWGAVVIAKAPLLVPFPTMAEARSDNVTLMLGVELWCSRMVVDRW